MSVRSSKRITCSEGNTRDIWADIREAKDMIGFEPKVSMSRGLQRFCKECVGRRVVVLPLDREKSSIALARRL